MEALKDKKYKQFDYISRYTGFPYYYNTLDGKYIYGITGHIDKNIQYVEHTVKDSDTLDLLSLSYYGRPDYYWIIADFNSIIDPFEKLNKKYKIIKIPTFSSIKFKK